MIPHSLGSPSALDRFTTPAVSAGRPGARTDGLRRSATKSLAAAIFGFNDTELAAIIKRTREHQHVDAQPTPRRSQAQGPHARNIRARKHYPASSIAFGTSERGAIPQEHARRARAVG
jgi:hypothetical protein